MVGTNPRLRVAQEDEGMTVMTRLGRTRTASAALVLSLAIVGCGGDDEPEVAASPSPAETAVPFEPEPTEEPEEESELYEVGSGDTLSSLAVRFGTTVDAIVELNDLDDADTLAIGDELRIPAASADDADATDTPDPADPGTDSADTATESDTDTATD
jgi:LysM repeat protein